MTQDQHSDEWTKKAEELIREYGDDRGRASESAAVFDRVGARSARDAADITLAALLAHLQQRPLPVREGTDDRNWKLIIDGIAGNYGSRWAGPDEAGWSFEQSAFYEFCAALSPSLPVTQEPTPLSDDERDLLARVEATLAREWNGLHLHKFQTLREKLNAARGAEGTPT